MSLTRLSQAHKAQQPIDIGLKKMQSMWANLNFNRHEEQVTSGCAHLNRCKKLQLWTEARNGCEVILARSHERSTCYCKNVEDMISG